MILKRNRIGKLILFNGNYRAVFIEDKLNLYAVAVRKYFKDLDIVRVILMVWIIDPNVLTFNGKHNGTIIKINV